MKMSNKNRLQLHARVQRHLLSAQRHNTEARIALIRLIADELKAVSDEAKRTAVKYRRGGHPLIGKVFDAYAKSAQGQLRAARVR